MAEPDPPARSSSAPPDRRGTPAADPGARAPDSSAPSPPAVPGTSEAATPPTPHLTRGFLFADLRNYTSYVEAHGDHAGAELLARYRALVRGAVAAAHGAEIKTEGDSFYVVFDSASAAVRCGQEIIASADAAPGEPIRVGVGVHAGETVETAEGYVGSAVNIAARLCSQAKAGELVVSDTVRALTRTYLDVDFEPLGTRRLKGVNEQIALYRVVPHARTVRMQSGRARGRRRPWVVVAGLGAIVIFVLGAAGVSVLGGAGASPTAAPGGAGQASATPATASPSASGVPSAEPSASGDTSGLTADEKALLARVPLAFQPYCRRSSLPDGSLGGSASLRCDLQPGSSGYGADTVWYDQFDQPGLMAVAVTKVQEQQKLLEGDCGRDKTQAIGAWEMGITASGVRACYLKDAAAWILWTYKGDNIAARAVRQDGDYASLFDWWDKVASPYLRG